MTVKYIGMNRDTGEAITDIEHIRQSVRDILLTSVGTRVMRRSYGSLLSALIDQPQNEALRLQIMWTYYKDRLRTSKKPVRYPSSLSSTTHPRALRYPRNHALRPLRS